MSKHPTRWKVVMDLLDVERRLDEIELAIEQEPAVVQVHQSFMCAFRSVAASIPDDQKENLLDLEAGMNAMFVLGCSYAYKMGLQDGLLLGGLTGRHDILTAGRGV